MKTLIELFDLKHTIDNILAAYIFQPDRVVFLFDDRMQTLLEIKKLQRALTLRFPKMEVTYEKLRDSGQVQELCQRLISIYPDPVFDLTGGRDAISFAVALFCHQRCRPCICIDWQKKELLCSEAAQDYQKQFQMPNLSIEDVIQANGAMPLRYMHETPPKEWHHALIAFYKETLCYPKEWLSFCRYLQQMAAKAEREGHPLCIRGNSVITDRNGRMLQCHPGFAQLAYQLGFLTQLDLKGTSVSLAFADKTVLRYLTSQGTWLELYTYITAEQSGYFHECRMSVVVDWDSIPQKRNNVVNEIDVILMRGICPVFISCKTSVPSTEDLNEIALYAKKLGGSQAVAMLVTTTDVRKESATTCYRAKELDVILVQRDDLLRENGLLHYFEQIQG